MLTGAESINDTEARYQVKGTDLGVMWTDEREKVLASFGDTFSAGWAGPGSEAGDPAVGRADNGRGLQPVPAPLRRFPVPGLEGIRHLLHDDPYDRYNVSMMHATLSANAVDSAQAP